MTTRARQLLAEVRTLLADQGSLGLFGLDVDAGCLRPASAAGAPFVAPAGAPRARSVIPEVTGVGAHSFAGAEGSAGGLAEGFAERSAKGSGAERLRAVQEALGPCTRCPLSATRRTIVFGDGDPEARVVFVGEGPGREEDARGLPFVGPAGALLNRMLTAMKLTRQGVYIANVVKCRPPDNRFPEPNEQASCSPFLWQQLAAIGPSVVVALGRLAAQTLLQTRLPMGRLRGGWRTLQAPPQLAHLPRLSGVPVMPTFHPAYLLRRPEDKVLVWRDLQAVMARLAPPASGGEVGQHP